MANRDYLTPFASDLAETLAPIQALGIGLHAIALATKAEGTVLDNKGKIETAELMENAAEVLRETAERFLKAGKLILESETL